MAGILIPANISGAATPYRRPASQAPRPGPRTFQTLGNMAAERHGRTARMTRSLTSSTGGTGNAEPYNPAYRGGLDSLYTASVLAIRPKTGELVWHYQYMPNESFDLDGSAEPVIADL